MMDSTICWINHYPLDNSIGFASVCPLDRDLSGGPEVLRFLYATAKIAFITARIIASLEIKTAFNFYWAPLLYLFSCCQCAFLKLLNK